VTDEQHGHVTTGAEVAAWVDEHLDRPFVLEPWQRVWLDYAVDRWNATTPAEYARAAVVCRARWAVLNSSIFEGRSVLTMITGC
jgi:hypothetical protein